jgi:TRAP-type C4-dicarboxylate transport system permease large subunit
LAWVIIGGLIILTLIIVPVIYEIMENWSINLQKERKQILMRLWSLTMNLKYWVRMRIMMTKGSSNPFYEKNPVH